MLYEKQQSYLEGYECNILLCDDTISVEIPIVLPLDDLLDYGIIYVCTAVDYETSMLQSPQRFVSLAT